LAVVEEMKKRKTKSNAKRKTKKNNAIYEYKANVFVHIKQLLIQLSHLIHSNQ